MIGHPAKDTELDSIAAQVRSYPPLDPDEEARLLAQLSAEPQSVAREELVAHHLKSALDGALARGDRRADITDLYQEGAIAVAEAVSAYAAEKRPTSGLSVYIDRAVAEHLDAVVEQAEQLRKSDAAFIRGVQLLADARTRLRRRLNREPTVDELAEVLRWSTQRVDAIAAMLADAEAARDAEIVEYLDDE